MLKLNEEVIKFISAISEKNLPKCRNHDAISRFQIYCQQCGEKLEAQIETFKMSALKKKGNKENNQLKDRNKEIAKKLTLEINLNIFNSCIKNNNEIPLFSSFEYMGLIWLGYGAKQYVILDLLDKDQHVRQVRRFRDNKQPENPIRAFANGTWLVTWSNKRITVEDLLAIENGTSNQVPMAFEYEVNEGTEICPNPIFTRMKNRYQDDNETIEGVELTWLELEQKITYRLNRICISRIEETDQKPEIIHEFKEKETLKEASQWPYIIADPELPNEIILITNTKEMTVYYYYVDKENRLRKEKLNFENHDSQTSNLRWSMRPYDEGRGSFIVDTLEETKLGKIALTVTDSQKINSTLMIKYDMTSKKLITTEKIKKHEGIVCTGSTVVFKEDGTRSKFHLSKDNVRVHLTSNIDSNKIEAQISLSTCLFLHQVKDGFQIFSMSTANNQTKIIKNHYVLSPDGLLEEDGYTEDNQSNCINTTSWESVVDSINISDNLCTITINLTDMENYT